MEKLPNNTRDILIKHNSATDVTPEEQDKTLVRNSALNDDMEASQKDLVPQW